MTRYWDQTVGFQIVMSVSMQWLLGGTHRKAHTKGAHQGPMAHLSYNPQGRTANHTLSGIRKMCQPVWADKSFCINLWPMKPPQCDNMRASNLLVSSFTKSKTALHSFVCRLCWISKVFWLRPQNGLSTMDTPMMFGNEMFFNVVVMQSQVSLLELCEKLWECCSKTRPFHVCDNLNQRISQVWKIWSTSKKNQWPFSNSFVFVQVKIFVCVP